MTEYEFAQVNYGKMPTITDKNVMKNIIYSYLKQNESFYYMLMNREGHHYTIFHYYGDLVPEKMTEEIIDMLLYLGEVKELNYEIESENLEVWILDKENGSCNLFALFPYQRGVIEVG